MFNLDPGKLLVIAVVAIILLGPDRLPQVARQVGGAWKSFNEFRHRVESEVRNTVPDLPPTSEIARLARSPSALLNHLSTMSSDDGEAADPGEGEAVPPDDAVPLSHAVPPVEAASTTGDGTTVAEHDDGSAGTNGSPPRASQTAGAQVPGGEGPGARAGEAEEDLPDDVSSPAQPGTVTDLIDMRREPAPHPSPPAPTSGRSPSRTPPDRHPG